jgi:hypothetical protein
MQRCLDMRRRLRPLMSAQTIGLRLAAHDPPCSVSAVPPARQDRRRAASADAAELSALGQTVRGIEHHVPAVVQRILYSNSALKRHASQPHYSLLSTGPPPRSVANAIRRGDVRYSYGEIKHDVIAALMRTWAQIPHKRFLEKARR